jgi:hypothetical protein
MGEKLKLRSFIHNHIMQSQLHGAEQVVDKSWAEDALMDNQEYGLPHFWYGVTQSFPYAKVDSSLLN